MSESYEGRQIVGIDLHRRRSVLVRMTETVLPEEVGELDEAPDVYTGRVPPARHRAAQRLPEKVITLKELTEKVIPRA